MLSSFTRIIFAAAGMLGTGLIMVNLFEFTSISRLIYAPVTAISVSLCYIGIIWMFRTADLDTCITTLTNKFTMRKQA
jgi:hypothetical protein